MENLEKAVGYVRDDNLSKLKHCIRKYSIDVNGRTSNDNTLLHVACMLGHEACMRYLLKCQADSMLCNKDGDTPLHVAVYLAKKGNRYAYTDVVLPLIKHCPDALDVKNNVGLTARYLLQDVKERIQRQTQARPGSADHQSASQSANGNHHGKDEQTWNEKLFSEMTDEAHDSYEQDYRYQEQSQSHPESYEDWCERISQERSRKRSYQQKSDTKTKRRKPEAESHRRTQKLQEEHRLYYEKLQTEKIHKRNQSKKQAYQHLCQKLFSSNANSEITLKDIPWQNEDEIQAGLKAIFDEYKDGQESDAFKKYLKEQQVQWHPDRFMQKCGQRLNTQEKEVILKQVNAISQSLNSFVK